MDDAARKDHILIVDDEGDMRTVLALKLVREGYGVSEAGGVGAATEAVMRGGMDLVLLDMRLKDGHGVEWLKRMRARYSPLDLPVVVISGLGQSDDVVQALKAGANDYLTKPFDLAVVLARLRTQLALKRLKQANDDFLRIVSHDLKRPLTLILDVAQQLISDHPDLNADARAALGLLKESGDYMRHIIADLLELRAVRDGRLQIARLVTDIGASVRQAVARNSRYAESKGIALGMRFDPQLPHIRADDARIMQVLENLIGNAIKFCPPGACVEVSTRREGESVVCEVRDTGPGIAAEDMPKLFSAYAQLRNRPTGGESSTGLGLSIGRELIRLHGGEIGARNNDTGPGATFWFRLPIGEPLV